MEQYSTERLRLRPLGREDIDEVWKLVSDEAIGGQLHCGVQRTREEAARLVQSYLDDPDRLPFAVLEGESGAFAGVLILRRYEETACEDTVYLGRPFWNRGYARELVRASFSLAADLLGGTGDGQLCKAGQHPLGASAGEPGFPAGPCGILR